MAKTSRDARKHIRQLSELFYGLEAVGYAVVEDLLRKHARRKYLKQSLRRLIEGGFLNDDGEKFTPTVKGIIHFRKFYSPKKRKAVPTVPKTWDKKWRLVSFDVPGGYNRKRDQIRALLKEFNFCQLQKSVWACPNEISRSFWNVLVESDLHRYCKTMVVHVLEGDDELKRYFRIVLGLLALLFSPDLLFF